MPSSLRSHSYPDTSLVMSHTDKQVLSGPAGTRWVLRKAKLLTENCEGKGKKDRSSSEGNSGA